MCEEAPTNNARELHEYLMDLVKNYPEDAVHTLEYCFQRVAELDRVVDHFVAMALPKKRGLCIDEQEAKMAQVTITLVDRPDGSVQFKIDKGDLKGDALTPAQEMAGLMLAALLDEDDGEMEDTEN